MLFFSQSIKVLHKLCPAMRLVGGTALMLKKTVFQQYPTIQNRTNKTSNKTTPVPACNKKETENKKQNIKTKFYNAIQVLNIEALLRQMIKTMQLLYCSMTIKLSQFPIKQLICGKLETNDAC